MPPPRISRTRQRSETLPPQRGRVVVSCEGIHSGIRKQFFPDEGPPRYSGINMWRGVTRWKPFLDGATMVRVGWHKPAKVLIYPIRDNIDAEGRQLINWVCDIEQEHPLQQRDWNRQGKLEDFIGAIEDWRFDWLDVPAMCRAADQILEYPMVDQDPLPRWSHRPRHAARRRRASDAAARRQRRRAGDPRHDRARRLPRAHRRPGGGAEGLRGRPPPADHQGGADQPRDSRPTPMLEEVYKRTGDKPFRHIDDVISQSELAGLLKRYQRVAGFDKEKLEAAH